MAVDKKVKLKDTFFNADKEKNMKRIVTIQDISCVGKCSLTVALPIISAMGVETAIIPTAVLSTHTMFKNFTFRDLTDEIVPITNHWKNEKIGFDAIYTGYLGSPEQIDIIKGIFEDFKTKDNIIFVDPVMGDNGKLYPAFDEKFAAKMATLCEKADIIVPNITEASYMTGMEYRESYDEAYVKEMPGVGFAPGKTGVMGYDREKDEFYYYEHDKLAKSYHGTGDVFASTCVGAMMQGKTWKEALKIAADYTAYCIKLTMEDSCWYGVNFEMAIPYLLDICK